MNIKDNIKNPILIKNIHNYTEITEKILQKLVLEDISSFMKELGDSFSFIDNEYKIKIGDRYNYIDKNLKKINQDKTIDIIICKKENKYVIEYSSHARIVARTYELLR